MLVRILHKALRSIGLRLALVALLLGAQQGALTHALTHAGWQAQGHAVPVESTNPDRTAHDDGAPQRQAATGQCMFDLVYSQVLGGIHVAAAHTPAPDSIFERRTRHSNSRAGVTLLPYFAQGPPVFL